MRSISLGYRLMVVFLALGLAACGNAKRFDYQPEAGEMKSGAGLFSGKKGGFALFGAAQHPPGKSLPRAKDQAPREKRAEIAPAEKAPAHNPVTFNWRRSARP